MRHLNEGVAMNNAVAYLDEIGSRMGTRLACFGQDLATMPRAASLWPDTRHGRGITSGTFYTNLRRYLKKAGLQAGGVHIFRHSAAKLRRDAGESVEEVSRFLDHSS